MSGRSNIEKAVWTESDFEVMGWHDCRVHAFTLEPYEDESGKLLVDLDYITQWVQPTQLGTSFSFWVAPATLVFDAAWAFEAEVSPYSNFALDLDRIERSDLDQFGRSRWTLDGHQFTARLLAPGFKQFLRRAPIASPHQSLSMEARGGVSFAQSAFM
jgi:hypothetical protein